MPESGKIKRGRRPMGLLYPDAPAKLLYNSNHECLPSAAHSNPCTLVAEYLSENIDDIEKDTD
jgi:hypothetical protein